MERSHDEEITLITYIPEGEGIREARVEIFAARISITRSEFYEAYRSGLDARWAFSMNYDDYLMSRAVIEEKTEVFASKIIYQGAEYDVVRMYWPGDGDAEVIVR